MAALFRVVRLGSCSSLVPVLRLNGFKLVFRMCTSNPEVQEKLPHWAQTPLDNMILKADNLDSLFNLLDKKSLSVTQAANVVATLGKLAIQNQAIVNDILKEDKFHDVCNIIDKNLRSVNHSTLLLTLKNILSIGVPPEKFIVQSLETEVLWKIRKMSIRHLVQLLSFHLVHQQTDLQRKIISEALDKVQQRWFEISDAREIVALFKHSSHFRTEFLGKLEDRTIDLLDKMALEDQQRIFTVLAEQKLRATHLLRALAYHISKHQQKLSIKHMSNMVHAMNVLNFPDVVLLQRISTDLLPEIYSITKASMISSFLTAFGQLRWKHNALLEAFTDWIQKNLNHCRIQDMVSYILTLAHVNYVPMENEVLFASLLPRITKESVGSNNIWLDVVWSLAVLKKASAEHIVSVLTPAFVEHLSGFQTVSCKRKLLNVNSVAKWEMSNYKGPFLKNAVVEDCLAIPVQSTQTLRTSIVDTLSNYIPKGKYLVCNRPVFTDFVVDAEFIVDKDGKPLSLEGYGRNFGERNSLKSLPSGAHRVALVVQDFKDFTLHNVQLNGYGSLVVRILQKMGYTVVQIPYFEYDCEASTVKRLQYLQQKILEVISETLPTYTSENK